MRFEAFEQSLVVIRARRPLMPRLRGRNPDLYRQIRKAASTACNQLEEGNGRVGADRLHHFRISYSSAREVRAELLEAEAWGDLNTQQVAGVMPELERLLRLVYGLLR